MPGPEFLGPLACIAGRLDSQVSELDFWGFTLRTGPGLGTLISDPRCCESSWACSCSGVGDALLCSVPKCLMQPT